MTKKILLIFVFLIVVSVITTSLTVKPRVYAFKDKDFVVVIDPGHGGIDCGVTGGESGVKESELNLYLSNCLSKRFNADGKATVLTRTADNGLYGAPTGGFKVRDLKKRVEIAKQAEADIFISIHMNKYSDRKRRGAQVFYNPESQKSKMMAQSIQDQLNGLSQSSRKCSPLAGDYYVLNNAPCPAVIVECGFLSNPEDEKLLLTEEYREELAHGIFYGVLNYINQES